MNSWIKVHVAVLQYYLSCFCLLRWQFNLYHVTIQSVFKLTFCWAWIWRNTLFVWWQCCKINGLNDNFTRNSIQNLVDTTFIQHSCKNVWTSTFLSSKSSSPNIHWITLFVHLQPWLCVVLNYLNIGEKLRSLIKYSLFFKLNQVLFWVTLIVLNIMMDFSIKTLHTINNLSLCLLILSNVWLIQIFGGKSSMTTFS